MAHLIALVILAVETPYWLARPCAGGGEFSGDTLGAMCDVVVGYFTGAMFIVLAIGVVVWRIVRRSSVLVVMDALLLGILVPLALFMLGVPRSGAAIDPYAFLMLPCLPLLLLFGILGPIADLAGHRIERRMAIAVLTATAILMAGELLAIGVIPALVAAFVAFGQPDRRHASLTPAAP